MVYNYFWKVKRATHSSLFAAWGAGGRAGCLTHPSDALRLLTQVMGSPVEQNPIPFPGQSRLVLLFLLRLGLTQTVALLINSTGLTLHSSTFPLNLVTVGGHKLALVYILVETFIRLHGSVLIPPKSACKAWLPELTLILSKFHIKKFNSDVVIKSRKTSQARNLEARVRSVCVGRTPTPSPLTVAGGRVQSDALAPPHPGCFLSHLP